MLKRPLCEMASGFILGILYAKYKKWYFFILAVIFLLTMAYEFFLKNRSKQQKERDFSVYVIRMGLFILFAVLGGYRFFSQDNLQKVIQKQLSDGMNVKVSGSLSEKLLKNEQYSYYLDECYISIGQKKVPCNQILIYQTTDDYSIGQTLIVTGTIQLWKPASNDGNFDAKSYYEVQKISFWLKDAVVHKAYGNKNYYREGLLEFRQKMRNIYETYLEEADAGVISTMTLGDKSLLNPDTKALYQKAGISHILAISGLHISVIGMGLYHLLRKIRLSFLMSGVLSGIIIVSYGMMCGFGTSSKRAVFMFIVLLVAQWIGRSYDSLSALALSSIVLLWENPYLLWYAGFLLSFAAVLGVVAVGQTLLQIKKAEFSVTENFIASFSIQLITLPITAYYFFEVPVWSVLINFFVLPFLALLLFLALLGGILGMAVPAIAPVCFLVCHFILLFYKKICLIGTKLPGATWVTGKPPVWKIIVFYLCIAIILVFMKKREKRKGFVTIGIILLCFVLYHPVRGFEMDVLDVGQGDGIFLHTKQGTTIFFDGGSTDVSKVGQYRIIPFLKSKGVSEIDYWVVTHTDADHISGLKEVLENRYPVKYLVFSKYIVPDAAYENLLELSKDNGTETLNINAGDTLTDGDMKLKCIFPDKNYKSSDKNALSLVMLYEDNQFSGIFTGDISSEEEKYIVKNKLTGSVAFYKAAHHGSKYSNSEEFLKMLSPEISTVSCGENNKYGHPGEEAVGNMEKSGSMVYYTMESGRIRLSLKNGKIVVDEYFKE